MFQLSKSENVKAILEELKKNKIKNRTVAERRGKGNLRIKLKILKFQIKSTMVSFDENILMCLENIVEFSSISNEVHNYNDIFQCPCDNDYCELRRFAEELNSYVNSKQSPRLTKKFFLSLCKKYPQAFLDCFLIARNKELF